MGTGIVLAVAALVTLLAGLVPWPLLEWLRDALPL
jgi:hypothetical protein